jgi:hypothetical protein
MNMVVARDDNWGNNSFGDLTDPSDSKAGRIVASVTIDEQTPLGGQRPDNGFDVQVDPNDSDVVYLSWIDNGGTGFRLHVQRSLNRGKDWSGDLITVDNAAIATMAINSQSTIALAYLELVSGQWETHFRTTADGTTWDDLLLARTATNGFIGDYMRMVAVGPRSTRPRRLTSSRMAAERCGFSATTTGRRCSATTTRPSSPRRPIRSSSKSKRKTLRLS